MDAKLTRQLVYGLLLFFVLLICKNAGAEQSLNIAVAASFAPVLEMMAGEFKAATGTSVHLTVSSSGRLFAQIRNGAPFDLFFSADSQRPELLFSEGLCLAPALYATGRPVLWTGQKELCAIRDWKDVVRSNKVERVAMANPETAPYGAAAREVCAKLEGWPEVEKKIVYGANAGQAFQYAAAGAAQAAFVAVSLAESENGKSGCFWTIEEAVPIGQSACVTAKSVNADAARRFLDYATSPETGFIRNRFGYF